MSLAPDCGDGARWCPASAPSYLSFLTIAMATPNITNSLYTQLEGFIPMSLWMAALPLVLAALVFRAFASTGKHSNPPPAPKGLPIIGPLVSF
mgnify:FL=1